MARRKSSPKVVLPSTTERQPYYLPNDAPWGGFINIRLDEEQKGEFFEWMAAHVAHYPAYFDDLIGAGLKATFSYDVENDCYILALQGGLVGSMSGSRFVSTSRAGTMSEVIALTVWKHIILTEGDYGNFKPRDLTFMKWG